MQENFKRDLSQEQNSTDKSLRSSVQCKETNASSPLQRGRSGIFTVAHFFTKILRMTAISLIISYKMAISPLLPPACRFTPTCSQYMIDAIERYGIFKGVYLGVRRLLRCHPFHPGGYDPVK